MDVPQTGKEGNAPELLEGLQFLPSYSVATRSTSWTRCTRASAKAWNVLLKTVEELYACPTRSSSSPPPRCARSQSPFCRAARSSSCAGVEPEELGRCTWPIRAREGVTVAPDALAMVARAAEGSVRDALSLLDQAIATAEGLFISRWSSRCWAWATGWTLDLFDTVMRGDAKGALERFGQLYASAPILVAVGQDLLEIGHWLAGPEGSGSRPTLQPGIAAAAAERAAAMAEGAVAAGPGARLADAAARHRRDPVAPDARGAAEMLLSRIACVSDLPSPTELARLFGAVAMVPNRSHCRRGPRRHRRRPLGSGGRSPPWPSRSQRSQRRVLPLVAVVPSDDPADFAEFVARLRDGGEAPLAAWLSQSAHLIRFEPGRVELRL